MILGDFSKGKLTAWPSRRASPDICPTHTWDRGARQGSARRGLAPSDAAGSVAGASDLGRRNEIPGAGTMPC